MRHLIASSRSGNRSASFKVPESVYFDKAGKVLYVSNIDGEPWGKDGAGSIGKLGLDGKVIAAEWVKGCRHRRAWRWRRARCGSPT